MRGNRDRQIQRAMQRLADAIAMLDVRLAVLEEMTLPEDMQDAYKAAVERAIVKRKAERARREEAQASTFKRQMDAMFRGDEIDPQI